jgi:hypothetical protein
MFPMIFQSSMGPRQSSCDVPSGTTQGHDCLIRRCILGNV